jgi:chromate transporter
MSQTPAPLGPLALHFALFSVLAVGGVNAVTPEIHRQVVEVSHWMSDREFAELFAVAQATPGPNMLISTVVGWRVAGILGAVVATVALCGPSSLIVYAASHAWDRFRDRPWRAIVQAGMAPVVVGLIGSSGYLLAKGAAADWKGVAVAAASAALIWRTRLNPLWMLAGAAGLAIVGVV